jgi:hypothetical protein
MDLEHVDDAIVRRMRAIEERVQLARQAGLYFYNQPISELHGGAHVWSMGEMGMYASYSYLG